MAAPTHLAEPVASLNRCAVAEAAAQARPPPSAPRTGIAEEGGRWNYISVGACPWARSAQLQTGTEPGDSTQLVRQVSVATDATCPGKAPVDLAAHSQRTGRDGYGRAPEELNPGPRTSTLRMNPEGRTRPNLTSQERGQEKNGG